VVPAGAAGCVVVLHEVWGLVEHTKDVCKRIGKLGFAATAPNLYSGYDDILTPDKVQQAMEGVWELSLEERRDKAKVAETLTRKGAGQSIKKVAAVLYDPQFRDRMFQKAISAAEVAQSRFSNVATLGFCIGGGLSMKVATSNKALNSAVSFYGVPPPSSDVKNIEAPVLAIFANQDEIINEDVPAFVKAIIKENKDLTLKTYSNTKHGFFNDTRESVYNRRAAEEAWGLTRWFLERTIGKH
jgi:carboxymethylenebutenolidase